MFLFLYFCMFVSKVTLEVVDELNFFFMDGMYSNKPFDFRADANHFPELGNY